MIPRVPRRRAFFHHQQLSVHLCSLDFSRPPPRRRSFSPTSLSVRRATGMGRKMRSFRYSGDNSMADATTYLDVSSGRNHSSSGRKNLTTGRESIAARGRCAPPRERPFDYHNRIVVVARDFLILRIALIDTYARFTDV